MAPRLAKRLTGNNSAISRPSTLWLMSSLICKQERAGVECTHKITSSFCAIAWEFIVWSYRAQPFYTQLFIDTKYSDNFCPRTFSIFYNIELGYLWFIRKKLFSSFLGFSFRVFFFSLFEYIHISIFPILQKCNIYVVAWWHLFFLTSVIYSSCVYLVLFQGAHKKEGKKNLIILAF